MWWRGGWRKYKLVRCVEYILSRPSRCTFFLTRCILFTSCCWFFLFFPRLSASFNFYVAYSLSPPPRVIFWNEFFIYFVWSRILYLIISVLSLTRLKTACLTEFMNESLLYRAILFWMQWQLLYVRVVYSLRDWIPVFVFVCVIFCSFCVFFCKYGFRTLFFFLSFRMSATGCSLVPACLLPSPPPTLRFPVVF